MQSAALIPHASAIRVEGAFYVNGLNTSIHFRSKLKSKKSQWLVLVRVANQNCVGKFHMDPTERKH